MYLVPDAWKKVLPTANFLIKYTMKETGNALEGDEALELTAANYGRDELWLLLEPCDTPSEISVRLQPSEIFALTSS